MDLPNYDIHSKKDRLAEVQSELNEPKTGSDQKLFQSLGMEYTELKELIDTWDELAALHDQISQARELLADDDYAEIAQAEVSELDEKISTVTKKFRELTIPKLPDDEKPAIMEFRAGTGGTEASLFTEEILRMYLRYLANNNIPNATISINYQAEGGIKEATIEVNQPGAYGKLRFESGVHRVQRVPVTESGGRIHTSAISVAVLPQVEAEDVEINDSDLRIEVFRSSGPGGQSVNTTDSAVRITHEPTGISISCQDGKSQHKNKEKAMQILASKLYEIQQEEASKAAQEIRTAAVKSGDRSAKIRTYNFQQGRVTDHRTKDTWYNLTGILEGELEDVVPVVNKRLRGIDQK